MNDHPTSQQPHPPLKQMPDYCYCSELPHTVILQRQQTNPLPFEEAMQIHCSSWESCGRCLWFLEQLFRAEKCYVE